MLVRITQLDGKLPNLALMRLSAYHRARGDEILFTRSPYNTTSDRKDGFAPQKDLFRPEPDIVYGSAIFSFSAERVARFEEAFPKAIVGGTWDISNPVTIEQFIGDADEGLDYSNYPDFEASIGFTARGCRLKCGFCVVPHKEGKPHSVMSVRDIWRGPGYKKHLHLLDNDFFGQPEETWRSRIDEMKTGQYKVCFNQGINIRMVTDSVAEALSSIEYYDDQFQQRRLYTAWDNLGDEKRFMKGVDRLKDHGVSPKHLMAYMLVGYDRRETWGDVIYRFDRMVERGIKPYPMVYGNKKRTLPVGAYEERTKRLRGYYEAKQYRPKLGNDLNNKTLGDFQRWAIRQYYTIRELEDYDPNVKGHFATAA